MPIVITSLLLSTTLASFSGLKRSIYEKVGEFYTFLIYEKKTTILSLKK
jgi:hypothetical protein